MVRIKRLTPMLNVADIERSLNFYQAVAGFEPVSPRDALEQWRRAHVRAGDCELMLSESGGPASPPAPADAAEDDGWPAIYYFYPEDVTALHGEIRCRGFRPSDLRVTFYGMKA